MEDLPGDLLGELIVHMPIEVSIIFTSLTRATYRQRHIKIPTG